VLIHHSATAPPVNTAGCVIEEQAMLLRILTGVGLFALGYYLGKEVARTEGVRADLEAARGEGETAETTPPGKPAKDEDPPT
jgi:hypothetical protein